jgi:hypothetical protein
MNINTGHCYGFFLYLNPTTSNSLSDILQASITDHLSILSLQCLTQLLPHSSARQGAGVPIAITRECSHGYRIDF